MTAASRPDWFGDHTAAARPSRVLSGPVVGVVSVGLAVFLTVTITAGLLIWNEPADLLDRRIGGPDLQTAVPTPVAQLEQNTRTARIGTASLVLPDDPYRVHPEPLSVDGVIDSFFWASATVHPRYDARRDWSATMLLGRLSPGATSGDLEQDGRWVLDRMSTEFFDDHPTAVRQVSVADHAVDGHPGILATATVHYTVPGLASRHDAVSTLLVRLDDGSVVVAATSVPDDTDPALARQAADALRTLSIG